MANAHMALRGVASSIPRNNQASLTPTSASSFVLQKSPSGTHLPAAQHCHGVCMRSELSKLRGCGNSGAQCWRRMQIDARRGGRRRNVSAQAGSVSLLAKEMERVAAKESLLLSIKDAGGLKGLSDPTANDKAKIEVNEKILHLERLNPTPRPTTSPVLEGLWQFEWAGARSPGIVAARTFLGGLPSALASIDSLTLRVLAGSTKATGTIKIFNTVESSFILLTKLTVEGPMKLKEEYVEGLLATPTLPEGNIPSQLKGVVGQITAAIQSLPDAVKDTVNGGLKLPLTGTFSRELLISYLDEEVLVARDKSGVPDVLLRLETPAIDNVANVIVPEYMS